jgi:hypothetical protein
MPNENKNYINKPFMLNLDDPEEKALYDWLKDLKKREFKRETKAFWMKKMRESGENEI